MKVLPRIARYNMADVTNAAKISLQGLYRARLSAFHKGAKTLPPQPIAVLDDQLSAQKHLLHPAGDASALEQAVIDAAMMVLGANGPVFLGVEQHDIGVRAHRDRALAREQA